MSQGEGFINSAGGNVRLEMYNNTLYSPDRPFDVRLPAHSLVANNIFVGSGLTRFDTDRGITVDRNIYHGFAGPAADVHAINADPLFADPGTGRDGIDTVSGYKLRAGSPAIGAGRLIPDNGGRDYWGNAVSATAAPTIGAYAGATTPGSLLLERARARCVADTVRRERAVRLGIIDDATFGALTRRLAEENAYRERRDEAGEVLYGPVEYTLVDFENKELADFATAEEKTVAETLRADAARVDAFIATQPELQAETDVERARTIAVQMMARDMVDSEISRAVDQAEVVPHWDWFANVDVADLLAETTGPSR